MAALMQTNGLDTKNSVPQMIEQFIGHISSLEEPLLIIDDAHKLKDRVLHLVVLLANALAGKVGIIVMGNSELRMRIIDGVRLKKIGFDEIYKSIGRRFITLGSLGPKDAELVCRANGVYDEDMINHITGACDNDLHTAVHLIQQSQLSQAA
jgi:type II secretory pathway predicted ATPase ExeA